MRSLVLLELRVGQVAQLQGSESMLQQEEQAHRRVEALNLSRHVAARSYVSVESLNLLAQVRV